MDTSNPPRAHKPLTEPSSHAAGRAGNKCSSSKVSQKRYDVSKRRFLIDKITITEMNNAQIDRDRSQQNYINALRNYWNIYYTLRQLSLYDYILDKPLE
jgi:outer membrane protein TolC